MYYAYIYIYMYIFIYIMLYACYSLLFICVHAYHVVGHEFDLAYLAERVGARSKVQCSTLGHGGSAHCDPLKKHPAEREALALHEGQPWCAQLTTSLSLFIALSGAIGSAPSRRNATATQNIGLELSQRSNRPSLPPPFCKRQLGGPHGRIYSSSCIWHP